MPEENRAPSAPSPVERSRHAVLLRGVLRHLASLLGFVVLVVGVLLIPLPGPGLLVCVLGLALLSQQYRWARRLRHRGLELLERADEANRASVLVTVLVLLASLLAASLAVLVLTSHLPGGALTGGSMLLGALLGATGALVSRFHRPHRR